MKQVEENTGGRAWGQIAICVALFLGGVFCLGITMAINFEQGWSLGATEYSRQAYSASALAVDIVGVGLFALVAGLLYRNGQPGKGAIMTAVVVMFAGFSMVMFYGFGATNRIAPAKQAAAENAARLSAQTTSDLAMAQRQKDHITFLQEQVRQLGMIASGRNVSDERRKTAKAQQQDALDRLGQVAFGTVTVDVAPVAATPDPQAQAIADDLGWSIESVQKLLTGVLGFLLITAKALSFHFAARLWPKAPEPRAKAKPEDVMTDIDNGGPNVVAGPWRSGTAVGGLSLGASAQGALDLGIDPAVANLAHDLRAKVDEIMSDEDLVLRFVDEATTAAPGHKTQSMHAYRHFSKWLEHNNFKMLSAQAFGRALVALNRNGKLAWPRVSDGTVVHYDGRVLDLTQSWCHARAAAA